MTKKYMYIQLVSAAALRRCSRWCALFCLFSGLTSCFFFQAGSSGPKGQGLYSPAEDEESSALTPIRSNWFQPFEEQLLEPSGNLVGKRAFREISPLCDERVSSCQLFLGITATDDPKQEGEVLVFHSGSMHGIALGVLQSEIDLIDYHALSGSLLVSSKNKVTRLSLPDMRAVGQLDRVRTSIRALDVSTIDNLVLLGAADGRLYRWGWEIEEHPSERAQGRFDVERYFAHASVVSGVRFHPSGRVFFSGDWTGSIIAWKGFEQDPYSGAYDENIFGTGFFTEVSPRKPVKGTLKSRIESLEIDPNGSYLATAYDAGSVDIWKLRGIVKVLRVNHHRGAIPLLALGPSATSVLTYGRDQRLVVSRVEKERNDSLSEDLYQAEEIFAERLPRVYSAHYVTKETILLGTGEGLKILQLFEDRGEIDGNGE